MIRNQSGLLTDAGIIKSETQESANTATRVGTAIFDTVDTLYNCYCTLHKQGRGGLAYKISGYDLNQIQLQVVRWNRKSHCYKFVSGAGFYADPNDRFINFDAAKTSRPRMNLQNTQGVLNYVTDVDVLLLEMLKMRTRVYIQKGTDNNPIYFNTERAGKHFNAQTGTYDGDVYFRSPRYGLALTYKGQIISNVIGVSIGYRPNLGRMSITNLKN